MTHIEQRLFLTDLVGKVVSEIHIRIDEGKIPPAWDGKELRVYVAEKFQEMCFPLTRKQQRDFRNTRLVNNL